ncbi:MAG: HAD-IA family hydrolase [Candidatus Izemoplasmatales bacterium]
MQKINTVLFDLDGTLVDSNELIIQSFKETFKRYQPNHNYSRQQFIEMIGPPLKETFRIVSEEPKIINEMIDFYRNFYQKHEFEYISLYPNVIETLDQLKKLNINLGIVTTKFKESAMPSIKHFQIDKYIKNYSFLGSVKEHKPSPQPIFHALEQCSNVDLALMVGDNPSDIMAGKNANILTCGIEWSLVKDKLILTNPTFWITDYLDIIDIVKKER